MCNASGLGGAFVIPRSEPNRATNGSLECDLALKLLLQTPRKPGFREEDGDGDLVEMGPGIFVQRVSYRVQYRPGEVRLQSYRRGRTQQ